ncbi:hypothetical protein Q1695_004176 [Nippostrongylus brasiliensis]|nr:hypothetical protein Q1695_004176 [Nippostrongylus brasiliensis]
MFQLAYSLMTAFILPVILITCRQRRKTVDHGDERKAEPEQKVPSMADQATAREPEKKEGLKSEKSGRTVSLQTAIKPETSSAKKPETSKKEEDDGYQLKRTVSTHHFDDDNKVLKAVVVQKSRCSIHDTQSSHIGVEPKVEPKHSAPRQAFEITPIPKTTRAERPVDRNYVTAQIFTAQTQRTASSASGSDKEHNKKKQPNKKKGHNKKKHKKHKKKKKNGTNSTSASRTNSQSLLGTPKNKSHKHKKHKWKCLTCTGPKSSKSQRKAKKTDSASLSAKMSKSAPRASKQRKILAKERKAKSNGSTSGKKSQKKGVAAVS